jgi:regulator of extracellular matrix RemA (YlzA/DUF370 family)
MALEDRGAQHQREVVDKYIDPAASIEMTTLDYVVRPSASAAIVVTLPPVAEAKGRFYSIFARLASGSNTITITDKDDSEGFVDIVLDAADEGTLLYSDGIRWVTALILSTSNVATIAAVTPGTVAASKAVVVDANKHQDVVQVPVGGLKIGASGSEVAVARSAAEINSGIITKTVAFVEDATSTTHTGTVAIPAGATVHNIQISNTVLWGATSAGLIVGDTFDANGYFETVDCKATDLLVGEVLDIHNSENWGGKQGAYLVAATGRKGNVQAGNSGTYYGVADNIIGVMTVGTPAATAGRTFMTVTYSIGEVIAAVAA